MATKKENNSNNFVNDYYTYKESFLKESFVLLSSLFGDSTEEISLKDGYLMLPFIFPYIRSNGELIKFNIDSLICHRDNVTNKIDNIFVEDNENKCFIFFEEMPLDIIYSILKKYNLVS